MKKLILVIILIMSLTGCIEYKKSDFNNIADTVKITDTKSFADTDNSFCEEHSNSQAVYVAPYGKKYHYKKTCAGVNSKETTLECASQFFDACAKCVN